MQELRKRKRELLRKIRQRVVVRQLERREKYKASVSPGMAHFQKTVDSIAARVRAKHTTKEKNVPPFKRLTKNSNRHCRFASESLDEGLLVCNSSDEAIRSEYIVPDIHYDPNVQDEVEEDSLDPTLGTGTKDQSLHISDSEVAGRCESDKDVADRAQDQEELYEVDNILDMKMSVSTKYKYKVAWKDGSTTWEPEENIVVSTGGRRMRREFHSINGVSLYNIMFSMDDIKSLTNKASEK